MKKLFDVAKKTARDRRPYDDNGYDWDEDGYQEEEYYETEEQDGEYYEEGSYTEDGEGEYGEAPEEYYDGAEDEGYYDASAEEENEGGYYGAPEEAENGGGYYGAPEETENEGGYYGAPEEAENGEEYFEVSFEAEDAAGYYDEQGTGTVGGVYYEEPIGTAAGAYYEEPVAGEEEEEYYDEPAVEKRTKTYYDEPAVEKRTKTYYDEPAGRKKTEAYYDKPAAGARRDQKAVSQETGEFYISMESAAGYDAYYENGESQRKAPGKRKKASVSWMDIAMIGTGVAIIVVALVIGVGLLKKSRPGKDKESEFANVGLQLEGISVIGEKGLLAMADAELAKLAAANAVLEEEKGQETDENKGYDENDYEQSAVIKMTLTSVQKDLKVKFSNRETGKLIANAPFSVEVTRPDKSKETWTDDDMDGIIYKKNIEPGAYSVAMQEFTDEKYSKYMVPTTGQAVEVQKDISYEKVDVSNEIKKESEIDVAAEDTEKKETKVESSLPDTVEWVASTVTPGGYTEVPKSQIPVPEPQAGSGTPNPGVTPDTVAPVPSTAPLDVTEMTASVRMGSWISDTSLELEVGNTYLLEASYTDDDTGETIPFAAISWSSDNTAVATVDQRGNVQAVSAGMANVSYYAVVIVDDEEVECTGYCSVKVGGGTPAPNPDTGSDTNPNPGTEVDGYVMVDCSEFDMNVGDTQKTKVTAFGFAEGRKLAYVVSSNNAAVSTAQVDESGNIEIKAVGAGEAVLTVLVNYSDEIQNGGAKTTITVRVGGKALLTLSQTSLTLLPSGTAVLEASVGEDLEGEALKAVSSDEKVATVSVDGYRITVTGAGVGSATVTVTCGKGKKAASAVCAVTVGADPSTDKTSKLLDANKNQLYVLEGETYREAVYADYYTAEKFFLLSGVKYTGWQTIEGKVYFYNANGEKVTGEQVIQGLKYNFGSDGALVTDMGTLGIDVSKWNGTIDWKAVKNSGISYVIIRCGYRGSSQGALIEDSLFAANIKGANEAGLKVGVYFYTQAIDEVEAVYEASFVLEKIRNYSISYPVFLDVEPSGGRGDRLDKAARTAVCRAFCETIRSAGYTAGIYANKTWLTEKIDAAQLGAYKIWLAQYAVTPSYTGKYDMWQYKSTGKVSGITGDVDLNTSYLGY